MNTKSFSIVRKRTPPLLIFLLISSCYFLMQVRKRPMNKKELAKNEEDIIETYSNSLTVHETKLKVSSRANIDQWFQCPMQYTRPCC